MLVGSDYNIYGMPYYDIDGRHYYPLNCDADRLSICDATYPEEKPLSLAIPDEPELTVSKTPVRTLQSKGYPNVRAEISSNRNLLDFMNTYPTSYIGDNLCTRWALYANTPLSGLAKENLYPMLRSAIAGKSQKDATNIILNFVQTAFAYEYDDKVWGGDRAFFADETLYYPYCDCEDRAILYTRIVRDLMGLKTMLVYYPGHLASAVHFTESVNGDWISIDGAKYVICDPTYIGAPVGLTLPGMNNSTAKVILLD